MVRYTPSPKDKIKLRQRRLKRKLFGLYDWWLDQKAFLLKTFIYGLVIGLFIYSLILLYNTNSVSIKNIFNTPAETKNQNTDIFTVFEYNKKTIAAAFIRFDYNKKSCKIFVIDKNMNLLDDKTETIDDFINSNKIDMIPSIIRKWTDNDCYTLIADKEFMFDIVSLAGDIDIYLDKPFKLKWKTLKGSVKLNPVDFMIYLGQNSSISKNIIEIVLNKLLSMKDREILKGLNIDKSKINIEEEKIKEINNFINKLNPDRVEILNMPYDKENRIIKPDIYAFKTLVNETIPDKIKLELNKPVKVEIYNGCGIPGLAGRWAEILKKSSNIEIGKVGNLRTKNEEGLIIYYKKGFKEEAEKISDVFNKKSEFISKRLYRSDIRIVFGKGYGETINER